MKKYIIPIIIILLLTATLAVFAQKSNIGGSIDNGVAGVSQEDNGANGNEKNKEVSAGTSDREDKETSSVNGEPGITGYVMKKENGRILVVNPDALDFSANGGIDEYYEAIWFSNAPGDINVGEKVAVWFDAVRESYPGQSNVKSIKIVAGRKPDGAQLTEAEAIRRALSSEKINSEVFMVVKSVGYDEESHVWNVRLKEIQGGKIYDMEVKDSNIITVSIKAIQVM